MKILIIEDDLDIMESMADVCSMLYPACKVVEATSYENGLHEMSKESFDLIFLDILLKGIIGIELIGLIHNWYKHHMPLIIVMSALPAGEELAKAHGADWFIQKPFELSYLESYLKEKFIPIDH